MTFYQGGKKIYGKQIAEIINEEIEYTGKNTYLEPFMGMCGVAQHIIAKNIKLCDFNPNIICFWEHILFKNWKTPSKISKKQFEYWKNYTGLHPTKTYVGFASSYGASWYTGFTDIKQKANKESVKKTLQNIQHKNITILKPRSYQKHKPKNYVIYCDPPYRNTLQYKINNKVDHFDHDLFWKTMVEWGKNNTVFISERSYPPTKYKKYFKLVWKKTNKSGVGFSSGWNNDRTKSDYLFRSK